ncbi:nitrilase-related carbon-nitrogen hydrolase, partial [Methylocucumis oryzae]
MKSLITVSAVQQACALDRESNFNTSLALIDEAAAQGADLVVLPELHLDPYFCQSQTPDFFALAQPIPGSTTDILSEVA